MTYALPGRASEQRDRRIRAIRRVLDEHPRILSGERDAVLGCRCGWTCPNGLSGHVAHRDHVADQLEGATR